MGITLGIIFGVICIFLGGGLTGFADEPSGALVGLVLAGIGIFILANSTGGIGSEVELKSGESIKIELVKTVVEGTDTTRTYKIVKE